EPGGGPRQPYGVRSGRDSPGHFGSLEGHRGERIVRRRGAGNRRRSQYDTLEPFAHHFVAIVRCSFGGVGNCGPLLAAAGSVSGDESGMNTREQLNTYLRGLESRLRLQVVSKGVAVALGVALGATLALVLITNAFAFSTTSLVVARITLFLALAFALGLALVMPLIRLNQRRAAGRAESVFPGFQERLVTYVERRDDGSDPFIDILAADTLQHAPQAPPSQVVTQKSIFAFATSAGAAGAVLLWMIIGATGYLGYGARLLWAGSPKDPNLSGGFYRITVDPGDKLVRRRSDLPIRATLVG